MLCTKFDERCGFTLRFLQLQVQQIVPIAEGNPENLIHGRIKVHRPLVKQQLFERKRTRKGGRKVEMRRDVHWIQWMREIRCLAKKDISYKGKGVSRSVTAFYHDDV